MAEVSRQELKALDTEYEESVLKTYEETESGAVIHSEDGWSLVVPKVEGAEPGGKPRPGETIRCYGRGFGFEVRGVDVGGRELYYRTPGEEEERHRKWVEDKDAEDRRRFEENRAKLDADFEALPEPFRRRIAGFRENTPDFRWKFEGYEMSVCKDAVKIAGWAQEHPFLEADKAVEWFHELSWEKQNGEVEGLYDGHSGNSFGAAVRLAHRYVTNPELVALDHGALCGLVGCEEYGHKVPTAEEVEAHVG